MIRVHVEAERNIRTAAAGICRIQLIVRAASLTLSFKLNKLLSFETYIK